MKTFAFLLTLLSLNFHHATLGAESNETGTSILLLLEKPLKCYQAKRTLLKYPIVINCNNHKKAQYGYSVVYYGSEVGQIVSQLKHEKSVREAAFE